MFKRVVALALVAALGIPVEAQTKKIVVTTFSVIADMVSNVAGDAATVQSITKVGAEIHGYEPTPSDVVKVQKADLVLDNGLNLERWFEDFYGNLKSVPRFKLTEGIKPMAIKEGPYQDKPNPHAWMSLPNALIYVENSRKALVKIDPANQTTYNTNAKAYSAKIKALDTDIRKSLATIPPTKRYLVSCEGAFSYLTRDYKLNEVYLWAINADQQGTPKQVRKVIDTVRANQIPAVFCESTVNDKAQRQVAQETGAKFGGTFYVDSVSLPDGPVPNYLSMLRYDARLMLQGLGGTLYGSLK
ncbi:metal ABC transporter substrate-binding protein [Candidatus Cyanaurora vandensis]|uniref:metal ABC transporter substrate-binding protein n=1 Tax=Candidatus Cyanaurora vandensis TaxID=2714958 RepID=UPI00257F4CAD|nr:metal ABC transporter substrate-binding protein [Candidatus Cyanaurora vandensis]